MSKLPAGWHVASISDFTENLDSRRVPLNSTERAQRQGRYPYYGANGLVDHIDRFIYEGPHVLLAEDGGYFDQPQRGVAYPVDGRFWVNNHAHILRPLGGMSCSFISALLNNFNWMPYVGGTTRLKLTQAGMAQVQVAIPPLAEQRRIVAKIDALSTRSKRARADLDRVEALAARAKEAVLRAAFSGELTRNWRKLNPHHEASADDKSVAAIRKRVWGRRQAELGRNRKYAEPEVFDWTPQIELPDGWRWVSVDTVAPVSEYGSSAKTAATGDVPVLRMGNIQDGLIVASELKYLPADHDEFPDLLLADGDLVFNRTNSPELVGKTAVYRGQPRGASFASYLIRLRTAGYEPDLLAHYINSPYGREWVASVVTQQVGQANVNGTKLSRLGVPFMSDAEQSELLKRIRKSFAALDLAAKEARRAGHLLGRLDQSIFAKAFRGDLVPQDPADEPASVLLERIRSERASSDRPKRRGRSSRASA